MPITVALQSSDIVGWDQIASGPTQAFTSSSITPGASCLLVAVLGVIGDSTTPFTSTTLTGGTGLTWTPLVKGTPSGGFNGAHAIFSAPVTSDPGSFTVAGSYANGNGSFSIYDLSIVRFTGHDTGTPLGGKFVSTGQAGNGAVSQTLDAAPVSTDDVTLVQCFVDENTVNQSSTMNAASGTWNTLVASSGASDKCAVNLAWRTGSVSTTCSWSDVNSGTDNFASTQAGVVIRAAGGGGGGGLIIPELIIPPQAVLRASSW